MTLRGCIDVFMSMCPPNRKNPSMKKTFQFIIVAVIITFSVSCREQAKVIHKGERKIVGLNIKKDSILLSADSASWNGNFFAAGDYIGFADTYYCSILKFDKKTGEYLGRILGKGKSRAEIPEFMYAYPFANDDSRIILVGSSLDISIYNDTKNVMEYRGLLDFGWDKGSRDDYASFFVYNIMEMTDFGIDIYKTEDNAIVFPLSFVNRNLSEINGERYQKGAIWGKYSLKEKQFKNMLGKYPERYKDNPCPNFEFYRSSPYGDDFLVCHATDSLIYVYDNTMNAVKYSFGYELKDADRNYTGANYENGADCMRADLKHVSVNASLLCTDKYIIRSCFHKILDEQEAFTSFQLYDCATLNLVAEQKVDGIIQFVDADENKIYGVNVKPNKHDTYYLYTFEIAK